MTTTDTNIDLPRPFWKSRKFIVMAAFLMAFFLLSIYVFFLRPIPLVISPHTTRITGPLTDKGEINFLKALEERFYPPELATDDNGYRDFVRLFGDVDTTATGPDSEFYRLQKYEKLGLDPNVPPTLTVLLAPHTVVGNFYRAKREEPPLRITFLEPWTLEDYPMLTDWVREIDIPLDAIADAVRKPIFFSPLLQSRQSVESGNPQNLIEILFPDVQLFREIARNFHARATYRIAQGNIDGAIDDKLTVYRLGRHVAQDGYMVQHLVGIAIEGMAMSIPVGANPAHPLTEPQIRRLLDGLNALPPRNPFSNAIEWERYMGLSVIQETARGRCKPSELMGMTSPTTGMEALANIPFYNCNWNIVCQRMNEMYDAAQEPSPRTKYNSLISAASAQPTFGKLLGLLSPNGRGHLISDIFITSWGSPFEAVEEAIRCSQCEGNLQRLSLAILLYQCEHGKLPDENWVTQITPYLGENPERYFSCPSNPAPEGATSYAMVRYDDTVAGSLLLVELPTSVPLSKAVVSVDDVRFRRNIGGKHPGIINTAHRSAAVQSLSTKATTEELERLLGLAASPSEAIEPD